jgi:DNA-binding MarR family transcriptional regulator
MPIGRNIPGPRYDALLQLLRTAETLWNASRLFFDEWKLGPSQFNLLNLLSDRIEGVSQTELSRQLIMHRSNVTGLVDRLEARGLVRREAIPEDRRVYRVVLTGAGRKLLDEVLPRYYEAAEQVWGSIPAARVRQLLMELKQLTANAEKLVGLAKTESRAEAKGV